MNFKNKTWSEIEAMCIRKDSSELVVGDVLIDACKNPITIKSVSKPYELQTPGRFQVKVEKHGFGSPIFATFGDTHILLNA